MLMEKLLQVTAVYISNDHKMLFFTSITHFYILFWRIIIFGILDKIILHILFYCCDDLWVNISIIYCYGIWLWDLSLLLSKIILSFLISYLIRDCKDVSSYVDQRRAAPSWSAGELFQLSTIVLFFLTSRATYPFFFT